MPGVVDQDVDVTSVLGQALDLRGVGEDYRTWVRSLFLDLAKQAGAADPQHLARQLVLLYDGAGISAWMDHDASTAQAARTIAAALVDSAIPDDGIPAPGTAGRISGDAAAIR